MELPINRIEDISFKGGNSLYSELEKHDKTLVLYWASWCPNCENLLAFIDEALDSDSLKEQIFSISLDTSVKDVDKRQGQFPIYIDQDSKAFNQIKAKHIPVLAIVDRKGAIKGSAIGEKHCKTLVSEYIQREGSFLKRKKVIGIVLALILCEQVMPAMAFASAASETANQVYVSKSYVDSYGLIQPLERGRCTDSYSKAWCDAHGFKNNRPVPHTVKLNAKERSCVLKYYYKGGKIILNGVTGNVAGALYATASLAYTMWNCAH